MDDLIAKRVRRCEVTELDHAEDIADLKAAVRALYETVLLLARRLPPTSTVGADPFDLLMIPPWFKSPSTGNVLPPPAGLDLETRGLAAFRMRLNALSVSERDEITRCQERHRVRLETLRTREAERKAQMDRSSKIKTPATEVTLEM
ncbi:MAG: hypothetical protein ACOYM3_15180 [Terrimicrobiaceae bacterium]